MVTPSRFINSSVIVHGLLTGPRRRKQQIESQTHRQFQIPPLSANLAQPSILKAWKAGGQSTTSGVWMAYLPSQWGWALGSSLNAFSKGCAVISPDPGLESLETHIEWSVAMNYVYLIKTYPRWSVQVRTSSSILRPYHRYCKAIDPALKTSHLCSPRSFPYLLPSFWGCYLVGCTTNTLPRSCPTLYPWVVD